MKCPFLLYFCLAGRLSPRSGFLVVLETDVRRPLPAPAQALGMAARGPPPLGPGGAAPPGATLCCLQGEESEGRTGSSAPRVSARAANGVCCFSGYTFASKIQSYL